MVTQEERIASQQKMKAANDAAEAAFKKSEIGGGPGYTYTDTGPNVHYKIDLEETLGLGDGIAGGANIEPRRIGISLSENLGLDSGKQYAASSDVAADIRSAEQKIKDYEALRESDRISLAAQRMRYSEEGFRYDVSAQKQVADIARAERGGR